MKRTGILITVVTVVTVVTVITVVVISLGSCELQQNGTALNLDNYTHETFTPEDLAEWDFWGLGTAQKSGGQFSLQENDSTFGALIISPESYTGDVVIRYKTMALTSATVLVVMHSMSDMGSGGKLTIPEGYNGNMGLWSKERDNYFFAYRNAAHNYPPFLRKYPVPGGDALATAQENVTLPGVHHSIEVGRIGNRLWLSIDGEQIIEAEDESMLPGGHIALRVRGTAGLKAACLIKDLEIYSME